MVFLSRVMRSLQARYPDVVFSVYTAIADDVICRLDQGLLDFGVLIEPVDITRYQFLELPKKDRWTALLPKAHPLAQKEALTPKDLSQERLITAERKSVQNLIDNWLGAYGNRCTSMNRMNLSLFNKCVMVEQGLGIALGLDFPYVPEGLLMKPLDPPIENRSYLVWKKGPLLSPVLGRFTDEVRRFLSQEARMSDIEGVDKHEEVLLIVGSMREKAFNRQAALMAQKMLEKRRMSPSFPMRICPDEPGY